MTRAHTRSGTVLLGTLFVVLALGLLLVAVWNASAMVSAKLESQIAADDIGQAGGVQLARAMNQLTAYNHAVTEVNAWRVLVYAYGGPEAEAGGARFDMAAAQAAVDAAYWAAVARKTWPNTEAYRQTGARATGAGAAIGQARLQIKSEMTRSLFAQAAAGRHADQGGPRRRQAALAAEWAVLDQLEATARANLVPVKLACDRTLLPEFGAHARRIVEQAGPRAEAVAREVGARHGLTAWVAPVGGAGRVELPVVAEADSGRERSQAVRATTPWVQYLRQPVLEYAGRALPLSGFAEHYRTWTNRYTLELSGELPARGAAVYVLRDAGTKGREPWAVAGGGNRASELFGVVGHARHEPPNFYGRATFARVRNEPPTAFAQLMLYNGNPQEPDRADPLYPAADWQPLVGWDLLNFDPVVRVPEYSFGLRPGGRTLDKPAVRLNWRLALVPATHAANPGEAPGRFHRTH